MFKHTALLLLFAVSVHCDLLSQAGGFLANHFTDFKSFFAKDEKVSFIFSLPFFFQSLHFVTIFVNYIANKLI